MSTTVVGVKLQLQTLNLLIKFSSHKIAQMEISITYDFNLGDISF